MTALFAAAWELRGVLVTLVLLAGIAVALDKSGAFYGGRR